MTTVVAGDGDPLARAALANLLSDACGATAVAFAVDSATTFDATLAHSPDVVLIDARLPPDGDVGFLRRLRAARLQVPVLVLTGSADIAPALGAVVAGATGVLAKDIGPAELIGAIQALARGGVALSPPFAHALIARLRARDADRSGRAAAARLAKLTPGELAVARGIADGLSGKQIAATLFLSPNTVKAYASRTLAKLEVANRVQVSLIVREAAAFAEEVASC